MRVIISLFMLGLLFLTSCTSEETSSKVFVIEEKKAQPKVFEVKHESDAAWKLQTISERNRINKVRNLHEFQKKEEEFQRRSELRNVRRNIGNEIIIGYDPKLDDPDFRFEFHKSTKDDADFYESFEQDYRNGVRIYLGE